ncbi:Exocyst complex component Sec5 family protein [Hibiscus syriacus]|uniref:Exocyst complex component Sec5 family protein n=1 Tax=Hibiscus syriacus TaxID=106335 RepID=A0A6A3CGB5_HIBSY|nr:trihelix transcription factor GT-2-like [Hibiscus syriacus]KAE8727836.1 Exocyst complex component Sec5 family protein [Hibiscus syriacus]
MLGGGDTTASVLGRGGESTDGNVPAAAAVVSTGGARDGSSEGGSFGGAANMFGSNGNNSNSGDDERVRVEEGESFFGGNRWPRQETLALLKIRSDMDVTFRDASVKGPLWEEVCRKLAELGYHRSAKKCREKFENVFKYHKRTKDGRTGKSDGKTYRFSNQLLALETQFSVQSPATAPPQLKPQAQPQTTMAVANNRPTQPNNVTVPSATTLLPSLLQNFVPTSVNPNVSADLMSGSTSSSTSSDLESEGRRKRKRKWKAFFERLSKQVVQEQEEMQKKFLEALEKREQERMVSEEARRTQEMARINRERELLAQESSIAAAKDAALMAFLQKLSGQQNLGQTQNNPQPPPQQQQPHVTAVALAAPPAPQPPSLPPQRVPKTDNGDQSYTRIISSRWPKEEVQALIELRSRLDNKYHDSGPKGPLWEEISGAMKRLGYNRNAKRCKEKWENINKYFKKVKDNQKKRAEDSKTCPYFHQLDALYREKKKHDGPSNQSKPDNSLSLMVRPEKQWSPPPPPPPPPSQPYPDHAMEDLESDQNQDEEEDEDEVGEY